MTRKLDPEEKRHRAILNRMARQGRMGDYLGTLSDEDYAEAQEVLARMSDEYDRRQRQAWDKS